MADGFNLATAWVQIVPTTEGIGGQIQAALTPEASSAGDEAGTTAGNNFADKLKAVLVGGAVVAAVKTAVSAVSDTISSVASAGDTIDKTSQKLGVSAEQYQALAYAANHCGFSTSVYTTAVKKLQTSGYEGTLTDYLDGLMAIEDPAERAAQAQEVLGEKVANEIAPYLNGSESMSEYQAQLESLGGMMSQDSVSAAAAYEDALTDMQTAMDGAKNSLVVGFLPGCTEVMNGIAQLTSGDEGGFESIVSGLESLVTNVGTLGQTLAQKGGEMVLMLIDGIATNLPSLAQSAFDTISSYGTSIMQNLPEMITKGGELLNSVVSGIMNNMPTIMQKGVEMVSKLASGLVKNLPAIVSAIAKVVAKLVSTIASNFPKIMQTGLQLLGKLLAGIIKAIPQIPGYIARIVTSIKNAFSTVDWASIGKNIITGIKNGLLNAVTNIVSAAKEVAGKALSAIKNVLGIHSPSTVMRDMVGKNMILGWVNGISANGGLVGEALTGVSTQASRDASIGLSVNGSAGTGNESVLHYLKVIAEKDTDITLDGRSLKRGLRNIGVAMA